MVVVITNGMGLLNIGIACQPKELTCLQHPPLKKMTGSSILNLML